MSNNRVLGAFFIPPIEVGVGDCINMLWHVIFKKKEEEGHDNRDSDGSDKRMCCF